MNPSTDPAPGQVLGHGPESTLETWRRVDSMAQLLHHAARTVWARAEEDGPTSPLHSLGLGIYIASGQAQQLLPDHYPDVASTLDEILVDQADEVGVGTSEAFPDLDLDADDDRTVVQLLTAAEELSRPLPFGRTDLVHDSQLVVDLCDLIREARSLGC